MTSARWAEVFFFAETGKGGDEVDDTGVDLSGRRRGGVAGRTVAAARIAGHVAGRVGARTARLPLAGAGGAGSRGGVAPVGAGDHSGPGRAGARAPGSEKNRVAGSAARDFARRGGAGRMRAAGAAAARNFPAGRSADRGHAGGGQSGGAGAAVAPAAGGGGSAGVAAAAGRLLAGQRVRPDLVRAGVGAVAARESEFRCVVPTAAGAGRRGGRGRPLRSAGGVVAAPVPERDDLRSVAGAQRGGAVSGTGTVGVLPRFRTAGGGEFRRSAQAGGAGGGCARWRTGSTSSGARRRFCCSS